MRLVLDTNVVVSALIWGGTPLELIRAATAGEIEIYTSPVLLAELRAVLAREHLSSRLEKQRSSAEQAIALYGELAVSVSPLVTPRVVLADDDHVLAAALLAGADLIVSGDRHFLSLEAHAGIPIIGPAEALRRIGEA
ncbi:putative toxin-antitoxin system toxin component, PIN family [Methylibium sp.]|uniref:putative toxin-antitoxin system toxin component, PIN family n=1 Tax=Methylibium sp. TaxID=2067992 RepID=UPI0017F76D86|nr:putative toxin-antitoxin system toxin component, PIN family [Methylibium sp.]MBA3590701.1 putative toxin-antitoxin system toxin component, PIN family [Methylibium sp.]